MSNEIIKRIGSIKFACLSPEEIRKMSVMKVITADTYDEFDYPIKDGLMDKRMGVIEPNLRCDTCKQKMDECTGHFGHIDLAMPIIHVGYVKEIKMLLEATCQYCGRLMLREDEIDQSRADREKVEEYGGDILDSKMLSKDVARRASKTSLATHHCPYCGEQQDVIRLDKPTTFRVIQTKEDGTINKVISAKEVRERLEKINDADLRALGFNPETCRPEWMVLTALPVPPVRVRPTIVQGARKQEDDLTHKLVDIIKINHKLGEQRDNGSPLLIIEDLWNLLQLHITTYFDNQTSGTPSANHRGSSRPLKTLTQRLKGKEGRFRSNLSGKRVNFSARTVISPDPLLSINEVGVPKDVARELTVPERVNERNIEMLRAMILRGVEPVDENGNYIPGVNYIIKANGRRVRLNDTITEINAELLEPGQVVERQLMDGDVVLFNRQPSLHRMSMMAHRVRIMDGHTFRFNLCDCPPYNADFDGDEMNMHILQSVEARAEARQIMLVQENILSPRYGGSIIGAIHDHITGAYFLTHDETAKGGPYFTKEETMGILTKLNVFNKIGDFAKIDEYRKQGDEQKAKELEETLAKLMKPKVINGVEYWSGKQLFSLLLPHDNEKPFNDMFKSSVCRGALCPNLKNPNIKKCKKEKCEFDAFVKIENGNLVAGTIDSKAIGNSNGRIINRIAHEYGNKRAATFINEVTRLALGSIMNHGFSTGIDDEDISDDARLMVESEIKEGINKVNSLVESYNAGTLEAMAGRSYSETLEVNVQVTLKEVVGKCGKIVAKDLGTLNPAVIMANTGARGSMTNLSAMAGCVGQQSVRGERLSRGYWKRTLPHFRQGDLTSYARGFVTHSYKDGLSPTEFFFHAMGGREGLVDTAVRTSRSGYMQRRLVSALEDLKIAQDGTVRNTAGNIIQFKYGEDGSDPSKTIGGKVIDYDDLFVKVLGETEAEKLNQLEDSEVGENYGAREKDLDSISSEEGENEDSTDNDNDYESE